jgi:hypothetical protein
MPTSDTLPVEEKRDFVASGNCFPYVESGLSIGNAASAPLKNMKNLFSSQSIASIEKNLSNIELELFKYLSQRNGFWWLHAPLRQLL